MIEIKALFDLSHTQAADYLSAFRYPWEALDGIKQMILDLGEKLPADEYEQRAEGVWVHKTAKVFLSAYLGAPCIIGPETEVRHCAFIRGSALVGANCVVGNSVELKNVILFDNVQVPHYNYVGDNYTASLPDSVFWHNTAHAGHRIYIAVATDNRTRIEYAIAAYLHVIAKNCTDFLTSSLNAFLSVANDYKRFV